VSSEQYRATYGREPVEPGITTTPWPDAGGWHGWTMLRPPPTDAGTTSWVEEGWTLAHDLQREFDGRGLDVEVRDHDDRDGGERPCAVTPRRREPGDRAALSLPMALMDLPDDGGNGQSPTHVSDDVRGPSMRLDDVLGSVVTPVVAALLPEESIQEISVYAEPDAESEVTLRIVAEGETFRFYVRSPGQAPESAEELRHRLAEDLQDFVAESSFGGGQLRPHDF